MRPSNFPWAHRPVLITCKTSSLQFAALTLEIQTCTLFYKAMRLVPWAEYNSLLKSIKSNSDPIPKTMKTGRSTQLAGKKAIVVFWFYSISFWLAHCRMFLVCGSCSCCFAVFWLVCERNPRRGWLLFTSGGFDWRTIGTLDKALLTNDWTLSRSAHGDRVPGFQVPGSNIQG